MDAGLHLLMWLLAGVFSTLIIFLYSHQFICLSLHLLSFRQSAFIPLLTFPYWPQQFLSSLAWLLLLLFILSAGSLSLFDLSIVMPFYSLHLVSQSGTVTPAIQTWISPTRCFHGLFLTGSVGGTRLCKAMVFHWLFYVISKRGMLLATESWLLYGNFRVTTAFLKVTICSNSHSQVFEEMSMGGVRRNLVLFPPQSWPKHFIWLYVEVWNFKINKETFKIPLFLLISIVIS